MANTPTHFINSADVADLIQAKDLATVRRLVATDGLPAHRIRRRLLFDPAEVHAWVRSHSAEGDITAAPEPIDPTHPWVIEQVAKFSPEDLRSAAAMLASLATAIESSDTR